MPKLLPLPRGKGAKVSDKYQDVKTGQSLEPPPVQGGQPSDPPLPSAPTIAEIPGLDLETVALPPQTPAQIELEKLMEQVLSQPGAKTPRTPRAEGGEGGGEAAMGAAMGAAATGAAVGRGDYRGGRMIPVMSDVYDDDAGMPGPSDQSLMINGTQTKPHSKSSRAII
jgi:hypothetical protein